MYSMLICFLHVFYAVLPPESQNHRRLRVTRDLWRSSNTTILLRQVHLEQVIQESVQSVLLQTFVSYYYLYLSSLLLVSIHLPVLATHFNLSQKCLLELSYLGFSISLSCSDFPQCNYLLTPRGNPAGFNKKANISIGFQARNSPLRITIQAN